ncbi:betaine lipid synthase, partial [Phenoliferia sp. Uapishka_3]
MSKIVLSALAVGLVIGFNPLRDALNAYTHHPPSSSWVLLSAFFVVALGVFSSPLYVASQFIWSCFLMPLGKTKDQAGRLDSFYKNQAEIYDKTRSRLLRGRGTMLKLSAAHLKEQRKKDPKKRLVWLDVGGGTGWNVEEMDKYFPIGEFDAVYVLDLCAPLLEVSKKRFAARGFKNVHCLLQDATNFVLPSWESEGVDPAGALDFVTMSYSLSMMPDHFSLIDRIERFLSTDGLLSVCDFYVSGREKSSLSSSSIMSTFTLLGANILSTPSAPSSPSTAEIASSFHGSSKCALQLTIPRLPANELFLVSSPYYVTLCTSRRSDTSRANQAYEVDAGNTISASASPLLVPVRHDIVDFLPTLSLGLAALASPPSKTARRRASSTHSDSTRIDIAPDPSLSAFHYGLRHLRVPYIDIPAHKEFRTWIYGFTWEDPAVDMQHLGLTQDDSVLCITSAGDNALHYAIEAQPKRIHCVDFNPCQGHLLELKLAAISACTYEEFWLLFGEGKHPNFRNLLDTKLSPFLTSHAYQFWRANDQSFASSFYLRGYSGWAIRLGKLALWVGGLSNHVRSFTSAPTLEAQRKIWEEKFRPVLLSSWVVNLFLSNPAFLWNALGVPNNQAKMFLEETTTRDYAQDTLDPVALNTHISTGAYHYQVCLEAKYTHASCPLYLTRDAFELLKADSGKQLDSFRLHTDSIINVMRQLGPSSLTLAIIMDLEDWFPNSLAYSEAESKSKPCELTATIRALHNALAPGGRVFWRSSAISPWYQELYRREGFKVECVHARPIGGKIPIDRVNMYASFWKAVKQ